MEFIINFYKELDTLNLIIFWGIIIVIILLLIFSFILINKNKKLKKLVETQNRDEEELPIIKQEDIVKQEPIQEQNDTIKITENEHTIKKENSFLSEEYVTEYRSNLFELSNNPKINEINEVKSEDNIKTKSQIEIPSVPYQKNVLREMALSQTSPIGINRQVDTVDKKIQIAKDLEETLNNDDNETDFNITENVINDEIRNDLNNIEFESSRKTEINTIQNDKNILEEEISSTIIEEESIIESQINNTDSIIKSKEQSKSEQYLEEVSRKLAEAEIPDEIERTNYELKQEEDAIISYKELMEKKDSIETVDEEDAIISIEELMNRNNRNEEKEEISKLYNLSEEEENENFIKELKQFRHDL